MNTENELNNLKSEIKQLKFQIRLLVNNLPTSRFLLENNIKEDEYDKIFKILDDYYSGFCNHKNVDKHIFENKILSIFNNQKGYNFCATLLKLLSEEGRYREIFETFYGNSVGEF